MLDTLARNWWAVALRGVLAIIFGVMALGWPYLTLITLVLLFGAYCFVDGVFAVVAGVSSHRRSERWWAMLLEGIAGIVIGVVTFISTGTTALVLLYFIAAWALITGVFEIAAAVQLRRQIEGEWALVLTGIASIAFGILMILFPGAGALSLTWLIGAYALVFGVLLVILSFRLRGRAHTANTGGAAQAA